MRSSFAKTSAFISATVILYLTNGLELSGRDRQKRGRHDLHSQ